MPVAQVTVPDQGSRDETLRIAFRAKQQLTDSVRDARDAALRGIHWLDSNQAYFELDVPSLERATQALQGFQVGGNEIIGITVAPANPVKGDPCLNCGNISPSSTPPICPSCRFQEISPCPYCNQLSSRMLYTRAEGQLFHCPECNHRVRMRYNEPLFTRDGNYRTPVVLVDRAEPEVE